MTPFNLWSKESLQQFAAMLAPLVADEVAKRINTRSEARTDMAYYASLPPDERKKALKARKSQ